MVYYFDIKMDLEKYLKWESDISRLYHKYYWSKHLKNWLSKNQLMKDIVDQINYPIKAGIFDISRKAIFEVLGAYSCVVPYDPTQYQTIMNTLISPTRKESRIVLINHDNFATMPIFIRELYKHTDRINKEHPENVINIKDHLYVVFWPTIATQSQILSVQAISNGIKTIPSGDDIPGMENIIKSIRLNFIKQLITITKDPNAIIVMAPTGTRDVLYRNSDGTINSILFKNDFWIENTTKLIKNVAESWTKVILVGTNGVWLKRPTAKKVTETNNNRTMADIYLDIKELSSQECISLIEEKKLMSTIAWLVRDHEGNSIAKAIDPIEFDNYKWLPQETEIQEDKYQNYYFKDSLHKKIVRKLYTLLR
jgi:hypothetical protein